MWQEILTFGKFLLYCNLIILYYYILIYINILYLCWFIVFILDSDQEKIAFHDFS